VKTLVIFLVDNKPMFDRMSMSVSAEQQKDVSDGIMGADRAASISMAPVTIISA